MRHIYGTTHVTYSIPNIEILDIPLEHKKWNEVKIQNKNFQFVEKHIKQVGGSRSISHPDYNEPVYHISETLYKKIRSQLITPEIQLPLVFDELLWVLYMRYDSLGLLSGYSGSIPPEVYMRFRDHTKANVECFASFFNHTLPYYFGLFYDLERHFGCLGNFFDAKFHSGFFICNPPFIVSIMNRMMRKIMHILSKNKNVSFLLVVPVWDRCDRNILGLETKTYHDEEDIMTRIELKKNNKWKKIVKYYALYEKNAFPYYDFVNDRYVHFGATNVSLLSSSSKQLNAVLLILPSPTHVLVTRGINIGRTKRIKKKSSNVSRRIKCKHRTKW